MHGVVAVLPVLAVLVGYAPAAAALPDSDMQTPQIVEPRLPPPPPIRSCVVPASDLQGPGCLSLLERGRRQHVTACNLPVVYLGGTPGPCPQRKGPPQSRVIPILTR